MKIIFTADLEKISEFHKLFKLKFLTFSLYQPPKQQKDSEAIKFSAKAFIVSLILSFAMEVSCSHVLTTVKAKKPLFILTIHVRRDAIKVLSALGEVF